MRCRPLGKRAARKMLDEKGYVQGTVSVHIDRIVDGNGEDFLDDLSYGLVRDGGIGNFVYKVVGHQGNRVLFLVKAKELD